MKRTALLLGCFAAFAAFGETATEYRFDEVKHKVVLTSGKDELRVDAGKLAKSGDKVSTGWFSYALIASPKHAAKFEIFSSTDVVLASGAPGVILSVDRGHLRAMFDKITGSEPRVVQTPGALLAVRGTKYDVNVDADGHTTLNVTEGIVEVRSQLRPEPMLIHAGEEATYGRREPPVMRPAPLGDRGRGMDGRSPEGHEGHEGSRPEGPEANEPHGHGPGDAHGSAPPPQSPPPPRRPPTE
jgi:FecR-like protein